MNEKSNLQPLFGAILLIVAGLVSPSNGVDDRSLNTPIQLITTMLLVIAAGVGVYFAWSSIEKYKESINEDHKSNEKKSLTSK
jgi:Na+/H+ antiporter NhaD/arsenite permease-like protein